jgi:hypothetical protein
MMGKNIFEGFEMDAAMKLTVPALRGIMGGADYYVITLPFRIATRYLTTTDQDENLSPKERENRKVTPQRFAKIAKYITDNQDDFNVYIWQSQNGKTYGLESCSTIPFHRNAYP